MGGNMAFDDATLNSVISSVLDRIENATTLSDIQAAIEKYSASAYSSNGVIGYAMDHQAEALNEAARTGASILDRTERGQILTNPEVQDAIKETAASIIE
jgi:hypothetical protein